MRLFIAFGSWGEIAPLLEIALRLKEHEDVAFLTTDDWAPRVKAYGMECYTIPAVKHDATPDAFLRAYLIGRMDSMYGAIEIIEPSSIVASFFCLPAAAYAQKRGVSLVFTVLSPYYFDSPSDVWRDCITEARKIGAAAAYPIVGLYPWYLTSGLDTFGYPELRPLRALPQHVHDFIQEPFGVVTRGTAIEDKDLHRMVNAIKAHGLKCLYLGRQECDADLTIFADDHKEVVSRAAVTISQAGVGTLVDCMSRPMVVSPVAYDQFYNAQRLIELRCAVGAKDSYIRAIEEAMKPRSYLPNIFHFDDFRELLNDPICHARGFATNDGERAQVH